ncbi:MAG: ion channel [Waterburya sp.]
MKLAWKKSLANKYSQLLATIILLLVVAPILEGKAESLFVAVVLFSTIIAIIRTLNLQKRFLFLLMILVGVAFSLDIYTSFRADLERDKLLLLIINAFYSLFIAIALITINRAIFSVKKVNADTIKGGISVFFLIGMFWALLYTIVYYLDPNAFNQSLDTVSVFESMFYFSFTTLTTLGYGDITPVNSMAKILTNLEAVTGMLYPSIFIARLVGLYTAQEMMEGD